MSGGFTPGPWRLGPAATIQAADGRTVCSVRIRIDATDVQDAHLIAAAPDLYEALRTINDRFQRDNRQGYLTKDKAFAIEIARAALAKARGEVA